MLLFSYTLQELDKLAHSWSKKLYDAEELSNSNWEYNYGFLGEIVSDCETEGSQISGKSFLQTFKRCVQCVKTYFIGHITSNFIMKILNNQYWTIVRADFCYRIARDQSITRVSLNPMIQSICTCSTCDL